MHVKLMSPLRVGGLGGGVWRRSFAPTGHRGEMFLIFSVCRAVKERGKQESGRHVKNLQPPSLPGSRYRLKSHPCHQEAFYLPGQKDCETWQGIIRNRGFDEARESPPLSALPFLSLSDLDAYTWKSYPYSVILELHTTNIVSTLTPADRHRHPPFPNSYTIALPQKFFHPHPCGIQRSTAI